MSVVIYHNPRCAKSRETLKLLEDRGIHPQIVEYLKTPPAEAILTDILKKLNKTPRDLIRRQETPYQELGLDNPELSDQELMHALSANPILLQRPIVTANGQAAIGRPPEAVLSIL
ncbi:arsenate reductase [Rhodoligotrophos appendicifer]|uniref:arsenate reductase (glutaredoxin) n=1 Tax=Rhodoligotrophos appendicifer TaxID=987056 RepID=UPI0011859A74|nr:arsenate reductase (glutaredoxin) [Rhodoligotrophos appendicifer]